MVEDLDTIKRVVVTNMLKMGLGASDVYVEKRMTLLMNRRLKNLTGSG